MADSDQSVERTWREKYPGLSDPIALSIATCLVWSIIVFAVWMIGEIGYREAMLNMMLMLVSLVGVGLIQRVW